MWSHCAKSILSPKTGLVLVDLQNDHASKLNSNTKSILFSNLNNLTDKQFDMFLFSMDWFPKTHVSFYENLQLNVGKMVQCSKDSLSDIEPGDVVTFKSEDDLETNLVIRCKQCVQNTHGAALVNHIRVPEGAYKVYKGTDDMNCSYSAFRDISKLKDTGLVKILSDNEITDVYVAGQISLVKNV